MTRGVVFVGPRAWGSIYLDLTIYAKCGNLHTSPLLNKNLGPKKIKMPIDPITGAALIAGTVQAGTAVSQGSANRKTRKHNEKMAKLQNEWNIEAANVAYQRQLDFYDKQTTSDRAYNDPSAVRQRYEEAGINPNAAYGVSGSYQPQQSQGLSRVQAAQGAPVPFVNGGGFTHVDPLQAMLVSAQVENIRAQTQKIKGDTVDVGLASRNAELNNRLLEQNIINADIKTQQDAFDLNFDKEVKEVNKDKLKQSVVNMRKQGELLDAELQNSLDRHQNNPVVVEEIRSRIYKNDLQSAILAVQAEHQEQLSTEQINHLLEQTNNVRELTDYIIANTANEEIKKTVSEKMMPLVDLEVKHSTDRFGRYWHRVGTMTGAIGNLLGSSGTLIKSLK